MSLQNVKGTKWLIFIRRFVLFQVSRCRLQIMSLMAACCPQATCLRPLNWMLESVGSLHLWYSVVTVESVWWLVLSYSKLHSACQESHIPDVMKSLFCLSSRCLCWLGVRESSPLLSNRSLLLCQFFQVDCCWIYRHCILYYSLSIGFLQDILLILSQKNFQTMINPNLNKEYYFHHLKL